MHYVIILLVSLLAIGCSDADSKSNNANNANNGGDPRCQVDEDTLQLTANCPEGEFCFQIGNDEDTGIPLLVCTPFCESNADCEGDQVCRSTGDGNVTCQDPIEYPDCPFDAEQADCPVGCRFDLNAEAYTIGTDGTCTFETTTACYALSGNPCLNGCPGVFAWQEIDDTTGVIVQTENGLVGEGWTQSQGGPEPCPNYFDR